MEASYRRRSWLFGLLLLGTGVAAGGLVTVGVLYKRTGSQLVDKLKELTGLKPVQYARYAYGFDAHNTIKVDPWVPVRSPEHPDWLVRRGLDVELVASGFTYPVHVEFVPNPGQDPDSPVFYVNELHGDIKYVGRDGKTYTYESGLNNYEPVRGINKTDEAGLSGMMLLPGTEDLIITGSYKDAESGMLSNVITRLVSEPGGKRMKDRQVILDLKEFTSPCNQIQQVRLGPDGKLYVSVGDAENHRLSQDIEKFGGKILRMNLDGTACEDNPFYKEYTPEAPSSYVYAWGVRNVFDFDFQPETGRIYAADNGKHTDRFFEVVAGGAYGWNGDPTSIRTNALWSWGPFQNPAPGGLIFLKNGVLGEKSAGLCYMAAYGSPNLDDNSHTKKILEFVVDPKTGGLTRPPEPIIQYTGKTKATVLGLAEGPDGLYFTDFFGDSTAADSEGTGRIWKVKPSQATLGLPEVGDESLANLKPVERGQVLFARNCTACHRVDGVGGSEGPDLTHVKSSLATRLNGKSYELEATRLLKADGTFQAEQRERIQSVLSLKGADRIKTWLAYHLEEPRFDHPFAKMPSFAEALRPDDRSAIIEYLMTRN